MSKLLKLKNDCYSFYKSEGWAINKNKKINHLDIKFDLLKKGKKTKALHITYNSKLISDFISIGQAMQKFSKKYPILLCIPKSIQISPDLILNLEESEVELITLDNGRMISIASSHTRNAVDKKRVKNISHTITDINAIFAAKTGCSKIFNLNDNDKILRDIKPKVNSDSEYVTQILNLSLIFEKINLSEINRVFNPNKSEKEKGKFFLFELAIKKKGIIYDKNIFIWFRKIAKLRNAEPTHTKNKKERKEISKIIQEITGEKNPSEKKLWEGILQKFTLNLNLLKNSIK